MTEETRRSSEERRTSGSGEVRRLSGWSLVVAIAVLVAFGVMVAYLVGHADTDERTWTRLAWLLSSVEAIAFGAAGALFGASVQRDRAVAAEQRAAENQRDAVAGRTLADTIKAGASSGPRAPGGSGVSPPSGAKSAGDILGGAGARSQDPYLDLAQRLFPD